MRPIEPVPISDIFVQGIAAIEDLGECARFVLYAEQTIYEAGQARVPVVVAKIVIPNSAIKACIQQAAAFMFARATRATVGQVIRLPQ